MLKSVLSPGRLADRKLTKVCSDVGAYGYVALAMLILRPFVLGWRAFALGQFCVHMTEYIQLSECIYRESSRDQVFNLCMR